MINIVINDCRVNCFNNYNRNILRNKIIISKQKHQFHKILSDLYNSNNDNNEVDDFFDTKCCIFIFFVYIRETAIKNSYLDTSTLYPSLMVLFKIEYLVKSLSSLLIQLSWFS